MENEKLTLNVEEAAKLLGISRNLGYQMAREGKLPTVHFGKRILISRAALYKMLDIPNDGHRSTRN